MDPLDYMVEDCWLHLLQFLSPKDKQALCDTCETFQAILQPQKTTWGFELIYPYLMKQLDIPRNPTPEQMKKALSLRSVCKSWESAFDKICGLCTVKGAPQLELFKQVHSSYDLKGVYILERFHTMFQTHSGNPFVGRQTEIYTSRFEELLELEGNALDADGAENSENDVSAGENEIEEREEAEHEGQARDLHVARLGPIHQALRDRMREMHLKNCQLLMELLPKHGEQIHYLSVQNSTFAEFYICNQSDACKFLQFVLCNTPNVRGLELSLRPYGWDPDEDTATFQNEIREYFEENPLPAMTNLFILNLRGVNPTMENLMLEAYGGRLAILYSCNDASTIPTPIWSNMRCLRVLELRNPSFETIEKILWALHSPLEMLDLQSDGIGIRNRNAGKTFFIDKFLLAAQHLPLKEVFISLQSAILKESVPFPQDFPRHMTITYLNIQLVNSISLTFLPFIPRLKELLIGGIKFNSPYQSRF